jgi:hypothetical protein
MTELPANANTYRFTVSSDVTTAMRLAEVAAKTAELKLRARAHTQQALIAEAVTQSGSHRHRKMEWWETTSPAKCEDMVQDLFDAGKWGELLAMHYKMQRLVRTKSASETVIVFEPEDHRFKKSSSEQVASHIVYLTELLDSLPEDDQIADLQEQVAKLQAKLQEHCPIYEGDV